MVNEILLPLVISTILGLLAGLGVGGGSLLMLWLTAVIGMGYSQARSINLMFFLPSALAATIFRWRQGAIDLKAVVPAILAGCIGSYLGAWLHNQIELELLKKIFGILLIVTGLRELFYRPRKAR